MLEVLQSGLGPSLEKLTVKKKTDNAISYGIVFGKLSRFTILMKREYLSIRNAIHNTHYVNRNLFTVIVRHEYGI